MVIRVYLVFQVSRDYLGQEERVDNLERKATKDQRAFLGLQDQGDQWVLLGSQGQRAKWAHLVNLGILVKVNQDSQVVSVLKVSLALGASLAFLDNQANLDPLVLQDCLL